MPYHDQGATHTPLRNQEARGATAMMIAVPWLPPQDRRWGRQPRDAATALTALLRAILPVMIVTQRKRETPGCPRSLLYLAESAGPWAEGPT